MVMAKGFESNEKYFKFERIDNGKFIMHAFIPGEYLMYAVTPNFLKSDSHCLK